MGSFLKFCALRGVLCFVLVLLLWVEEAAAQRYLKDLTLTKSQKQKLDEFKALVQDRLPHEYMKEDSFLIKWLRVRRFNIKDAEKMLLDDIKWRQNNRMDGILNEDWSDMEADYKYWLDGLDKEGQPLVYLNVGEWDLRKSVLQGKDRRFSRYIDKALEDCCGLVRQLGDTQKNVTRGILILNVDGFNLVQHGCLQCLPVFLRIITQYEKHHPECADKIIVLNIPDAAQFILTAARRLLDKSTSDVLYVFGTNRKRWQKWLLQYFDKDQLPMEFGGSRIPQGKFDDYDF